MIISASRRTDLPAFYAEWFMNRVREGFCTVANPYNPKQVTRVSLLPQDVDAFVFWTRHPKPLIPHLEELDRMGHRYYFLYTLLGYPRTVHPRAPALPAAIRTFCELADKIGMEKVIWRYDPVFLSPVQDENFHVAKFTEIAKALRGKTRLCKISILRWYRHIQKRFCGSVGTNNGIFGSTEDSKDDELAALAQKYGPLAARFNEIAAENGMELQSCAERVDLRPFGVKPGKCIDGALLTRLFGIAVDGKKDTGQRTECGCAPSKDIGAYDSCRFGCKYCYATKKEVRAAENFRCHDPKSPMLIGARDAAASASKPSENHNLGGTMNSEPIETTPGRTKAGKPADFHVQQQVNKGKWQLERIPKEVLGTPRDLEVYRVVKPTDFIIRWNNKAEDPAYCCGGWADLRVGQGACGFRCAQCFLILTHRVKADPSRHVLYSNTDQFVQATAEWLLESNGGERSL